LEGFPWNECTISSIFLSPHFDDLVIFIKKFVKPAFYDIVDNEIQLAIPTTWTTIPSEKLLGTEPCKIRHAFNSCKIDGKTRLINILVLPLSFKLSTTTENQLIRLRDYILSKDCMLVVINEEERSGSLGDTGVFIDEVLLTWSPNFLWLKCAEDKNYRTNATGLDFEEISSVIHDLWKGTLRYEGPHPGLQKVNLELMHGSCWKCKSCIKIVTGIAFPDRQLSSWNNFDWQYYNQLIPLSELGTGHQKDIQHIVDQLRENTPSITPVGARYSHAAAEIYFAAICPNCSSLQGEFHVQDARMDFLHSLDSRINGELEYHSFPIMVDHSLLASLGNGGEVCAHACNLGWIR
jgi:hypothetical protein